MFSNFSYLAAASLVVFGCERGAEKAEAEFANAPALLEAAKVPGLALAVVDDCHIETVQYFGVADVGTSAPIDEMTVFEAASLTKPMFAYIVMQLVDEGVIDLDAPLAEKFEYPRIVNEDYYAQLTPRMILSHRSGLPNWASDPADQETWGEIPFKNAPNKKFGYSGEAYQLLQAFVEAQTGKSLEVLYNERLAELMPKTSLTAPKVGTVEAFGHDRDGGKDDGVSLRSGQASGAAYSANSNAADYAAFLSQLCEGTGLSDGALATMFQPQSPTSDDAVSWALGWGVQTTDENSIFFHWGDNGPFKAFAALNAESRDGVVFFANAHNGLKLIESLAEPVVGDLAPVIDWLDYGRLADAAPSEDGL